MLNWGSQDFDRFCSGAAVGQRRSDAATRYAIALVFEDRRNRGEPIPKTGWAVVESVEIAA